MAAKTPSKQRILDRLISDGLVPDRALAEKQIRAGLVKVNGDVVDKPGAFVGSDAEITLAPKKEFVGRGAHKISAALDAFEIAPAHKICVDVGACTGGFTEVLLKRGAEKVYAIDVGYGDLDWKIRTDPRVVVMERTNVRYVEHLPDLIDLVTIDVSFISLTKVLPVVAKWLSSGGTIVALVKPQFEAGRSEVGPGGIIEDSTVHQNVLTKVSEFLPSVGLRQRGLIPSPILGAEGNKEFLMWIEKL